MAVLKNRAKMSTSTTGTGTITLGSAEDGYQSFADAGVANGDVVRYVIEDGNNFEIGTGTYTASGTTLSRTVSESSNSGAALNLSGSATVFITAAAEDLPNLYAANESSPSAQPSATGSNAIAIGDSAVASGLRSTAIGKARATGTDTFAANISTNSSYGAQGTGSTAIGTNAHAASSHSLAFGQGSYAGHTQATAIGAGTYATGISSLALAVNYNSSYGALATSAVAIGNKAKASATQSIAIGNDALSTTANLIALGGTADTVKISGAYTLPTSDGSANQVLTTNGSGVVIFADAGGDPDLYRDNASSPTTPLAGGANGVAIGSGSNAGGSGAIALGNGSAAGDGAFCAINGGGSTSYGAVGNRSIAMGEAARAQGQDSVAIGENSLASSADSFAIGYNTDATATNASAFGYNAQAAGGNSVALGNARAGGTDSLAAAIAGNSSSYGASGANSIAMGQQAKATGQDSVAIGKETQASGGFSLSLGKDGSALAAGSVAISAAGTGYGTQASGVSSIALGDGAKTTQKGQISHASYRFSSRGDGQGSLFTLYADTTDATATVLTTDNGSAGGANQIVAASDTCITFDGTITAMQNGAQAYASWRIEGLLVNDGGTTTLANSATTVIQNLSSWGMALSADNTNNALAITCTGEAAHNIRWVANIRTTECTFA